MDSFNPLSDQFRREAQRNVSQNIGSLKSQKELKGKSDELTDKVSLSQNPKSKAQAAGTPPRPADDAVDQADVATKAAHGAGLLDDKDPEVRRKRREESKRLARKGVPEEVLAAAKLIVDGQVHPVRGPKDNLKRLKSSPEVSALVTGREEFAEEIDIHEVGNRPMSLGDDDLTKS